MKILAIETATDACSASLLVDGQSHTVFELAPRRHTQLILPQIDQVLSEAGMSIQSLDAIAFGRGPGAFTGLRIAAGVTQGLALAADIPAIAVSSLAAMAQYAYQEYQLEKCYVALDARMDQVYWGEYQVAYINKKGFAVLQGDEQVVSPDDVSASESTGFFGVGSGWKAYQEALYRKVAVETQQYLHNIHPSAEQVAQLAVLQYQADKLLAPEEVQPVYLRNKVAQTLIERGK